MPAKSILVAEDDEAFRLQVGKFLRQQGYAVVCVEDDYQAVDFSLRETPDLLILDVHMPGMSGLAVLEQVRTILPEAKVALFSGGDVARGDADALLRKPVGADALLGAVREILDGEWS